MEFKSYIMDEAAINRSLTRISHEVVERNPGVNNICVVGIRSRGTALADILSSKISSLGVNTEVDYLDVTNYRDDFTYKITESKIDITPDFCVTDKTVIMVDDVLYTGRTARAAMEAVIALGRPSKIQLAVLIDRGHRELPIVADYVGKNVPTSRSEIVLVKIPPYDSETSVSIWQK